MFKLSKIEIVKMLTFQFAKIRFLLENVLTRTDTVEHFV